MESSNALTSLFIALQEKSGLGKSFDFIIFQSILLCLIVGEKNLILRTHSDDVTATAKCAILTLTSLFGISCRHLKIKPRLHPDISNDIDGILRSILVHNSPFDESDKPRPRRSKKGSHPPSKSRARYSRSKSYSSDVFQPVAEESSSSNPHTEQRHSVEQSHADLPVPPFITKSRTSTQSGFGMPGAVVFSGLENASLPSQRSLDRALGERKVVLSPDPDRLYHKHPNDLSGDEDRSHLAGVWNFPPEFMIVCVCSSNDYEPPVLLRSLLDKFSLSARVNLSTATRQLLEPVTRTPSARPQHSSPPVVASVLPNLEHTNFSPLIRPTPRRLSEIIVKSHPVFPFHLLDFLRSMCGEVRITPRVSLYLKDLFSGTRHCNLLDGTLLTSRAMRDAESLVRAMRLLSPDSNEMEFLRSPFFADTDSSMASSQSGSDTARQSSHVEPSHNKDVGSGMDSDDIVESFFNIKRAASLEVTERTVALVFPRVVSHRIRIRGSLSNELFSSTVFGGLGKDDVVETPSQTTKDVLVDIMKQV